MLSRSHGVKPCGSGVATCCSAVTLEIYHTNVPSEGCVVPGHTGGRAGLKLGGSEPLSCRQGLEPPPRVRAALSGPCTVSRRMPGRRWHRWRVRPCAPFQPPSRRQPAPGDRVRSLRVSSVFYIMVVQIEFSELGCELAEAIPVAWMAGEQARQFQESRGTSRRADATASGPRKQQSFICLGEENSS